MPFGPMMECKVKIENVERQNNIKLAAYILTSDSDVYDEITSVQWIALNANKKISKLLNKWWKDADTPLSCRLWEEIEDELEKFNGRN